jgi:hypothetical protein
MQRIETPASASWADHAQQEDEDEGWEDEEDDEPDAPDPFISSTLIPNGTLEGDLAQRRADARANAFVGEHRIYLSMPAGPGSLAEALAGLSGEGMVDAEFVDDGQGEPHILYRPVRRA